MSGWVSAFIVIAALAIALQGAILTAMYFEFRSLNREVTRLTRSLDARLSPILLRVGRILDDSEERIASIVGDASEIARIARGQAQKVDRVFSDAIERLRTQVVRADHVVAGALEVLEETGSRVRSTLWGPVQKISAVLQGLKVGLDFIRGQQRRTPETSQDDELFI